MVNKTPLRLIVADERPRPEERPPSEQRTRTEDLSGAPIMKMSDEEAITRKVPEAAMIAARDALVGLPERRPRWRRLLPAGAGGVLVILLIVAFATSGKGAPAPASVESKGAAPPTRETLAAPLAPVPAPAPPGASHANPEVIRVRITAMPVEANLSLDGNMIAGHRLHLEVPKDRAIHVVSASAPGYVAFSQPVSFSSDVVLDINLRQARSATPRPSVRARAAQLESRPRSDARSVTAAPAPRIEPGMNLDGPAPRPHAKPLDERNPYKP